MPLPQVCSSARERLPGEGGGVAVAMHLTSIVTDGCLPIPPTVFLAGAIGRAPESVTIVAVERKLVTHIVVGGSGPVVPVLKLLWSWATNCFEERNKQKLLRGERCPLGYPSWSLRNGTFSVP